MIVSNFSRLRVPRWRRARRVTLAVPLLGILVLILAGEAQVSGLLQELKRRTEEEGLALVRIQSDWLYLLRFGDQLHSERNPREVSNAWLSSDGKAVAWHISRLPGKEFSACPSPVIVEILNQRRQWQLPGTIMNVHAMAVSSDGTLVAFDGTYKPPGTGLLATPKNRARWITGLQYIDSTTNTMKLILALSGDADRTTSISMSPDGTKFVYDHKHRIYEYNIASGSSRLVAVGASPTWSPNGRWIAFRSEDEEVATLNSATFETEAVIGRRKIQTSVHWSPDSRYVMVAEPLGPISNLLHGRSPLFGSPAQMVVERIEDHATEIVYHFQSEGIGDDGFYWIPDYREFMRAASNFPSIKACDQAQ